MTLLDDDPYLCHVCDGQRPAMDTCSACFGRGRITSIGFVGTPWDEVAPGLWVGGHDYVDPAAGTAVQRAVVRDEFDVVVSLFSREGHGPDASVEHHSHRMPDAALEGRDLEAIDRLARVVADRLDEGKRVLVRCQAGLNRSSLVAALALVHRGTPPQEAIDAIRAGRSPNCLFNRSFAAHVLAAAARTERAG